MLAGAVIVGLGSSVTPLVAVGGALGLAYVAVTVAEPAAGLALFVFLTFFATIPGIQNSGVTFVKLAGIVLVLGWAFAAVRRDAAVPMLFRDRPAVAYLLIGLLAWAITSQLWATSVAAARSHSFRLLQGVLLVFVVYSVVRERRHITWVVWAFMVGAFVTALFGITGGSSAESFDEDTGTARIVGTIGDPNQLAATLIPALWLALFGLTSIAKPVVRWLLAIFSLTFVVTLILTESRGGIVGLGATFVAAVVFAGRMRARMIAVIFGVIAVAAVYLTLVAPPQAFSRLTSFTAEGGGGRTDLWQIAIDMFHDRPLLGIGSGNFTAVEPLYATKGIPIAQVRHVVDRPLVAHNMYLQMLAELGLVGFGAFLAVLTAAAWLLFRAAQIYERLRDVRTEMLSRGLLVGIVGMYAAYFFLSAQYEKQLWLLLGLALATLSVAQRAEKLPTPAVLVTVDEGPDYDRAVAEGVLEKLEQRLAERMDALLLEQERLTRRRAQLAARERELRARLERAGTGEQVVPAAAPDPGLDERIAVVTSREQTISRYAAQLKERERELERRAAELDERERALEAAPRAVAAAVVAQAPAPAVPRPTAPGGRYNLAELERAVQRHAAEYPGRLEDWESYIFFLRDYAEPDGSLAPSFDALVEDVFAEIV